MALIRGGFASAALLALAAACGGAGTSGSPALNSCGSPPPVPSPWLWLAYPESGSTQVSTTIGILVFAGMPQGFYGTAKVTMLSPSGQNVPVAPYTAAPSPIPAPYATPPNAGGNVPYSAAGIPTLSPSTTYTLTYTYTDFNGIPPTCTGPVSLPLGSFITR